MAVRSRGRHWPITASLAVATIAVASTAALLTATINVSITIGGEGESNSSTSDAVSSSSTIGWNTGMRQHPSSSGVHAAAPEGSSSSSVSDAQTSSISRCPASLVDDTYRDVPEDAWYREAVFDFLCLAFLDRSQPTFRGMGGLRRSESVVLLWRISEAAAHMGTPITASSAAAASGHPVAASSSSQPEAEKAEEIAMSALSSSPETNTFVDIDPRAWYAQALRETAAQGIVRGYGDCYGQPECHFVPDRSITRAEFAAMVVRLWGLTGTHVRGITEMLPGVPEDSWYRETLRIAKAHCLLYGDDGTGNLRPDDPINRAESVVVLRRTLQGQTSGEWCGPMRMLHEAAGQWAAALASSSDASLRSNSPITKEPEVPSSMEKRGTGEVSETPLTCDLCARCGSGIWNWCDINECQKLGSCRFTRPWFTGQCLPEPGCRL